MLSLVLDDALNGVDISEQYPHFYQRMLADLHLRTAFLESLTLLRRDAANQLEPLPERTSHDLSFLEESGGPPFVFMETSGQKWHIAWQYPVDTLRAPPSSPQTTLSPSNESNRSPLEDDVLPLLCTIVVGSDLAMQVIMELIRSAVAPGTLHPYLLVEPGGGTDRTTLTATLRWGTYKETAIVDLPGMAHFPVIPLGVILDGSKETLPGSVTLQVAK